MLQLKRSLAIAGVLAVVVGAGLLGAWSTVPGRVKLADVYWEAVLGLGLVSPRTYVGPHFWAVSISPDGRQIAAGGMSRDVLLFDVATGAALPSPERHDEWVMEVLWSPDGRYLASTSFSGQVKVRDLLDDSLVGSFSARDVAYTVAFHPAAPLLAWGAYDGSIRIVDLRSGETVQTIAANEGGVLYVTFTPQGDRIVSTGEDGAVRFFDPESGEQTQVIQAHSAGITAVSFTPDGQRMVSGGDDATVALWRVATGEELRRESPHAGWINFSTFLPDGGTWLSAGTDDGLFVWRDGAAPLRLEGHTDWLMCVRPFPDGRRFASTGKDGTVRIWNAETLEVETVFDLWAGIDPGGWRWPAL